LRRTSSSPRPVADMHPPVIAPLIRLSENNAAEADPDAPADFVFYAGSPRRSTVFHAFHLYASKCE
jgi:hypothetical protein